MKATAEAGSNIAFIKYWGIHKPGGGARPLVPNPLNPSISMTLEGARTVTTVAFLKEQHEDTCLLNGVPAPADALHRVRRVLDEVRARSATHRFARVESLNDFPVSAGIASSASGFAALALAAARAAGLPCEPRALVSLALLGSGSACRSLYGGFVSWSPSAGGYAEESVQQLAPVSHWPLADLVAVVSRGRKEMSSDRGHLAAATSPLLEGRVLEVVRRVPGVERAIRDRNLATLGETMEADALSLHAVIMTSRPWVIYWEPATISVVKRVRALREREALPCYFTIDAGPNVHVITPPEQAEPVARELERTPGVLEVLRCRCGNGPRLLDTPLF